MEVPLVADDVAARYARPRTGRSRWTRRLLVAAGALAVVLAFASVASSVLDREVRWRDVGFDVVSPERVQVVFEVYGSEGDEIRCQVRAGDARFADVGQVDVDLGPMAEPAERVVVDVRTLAPASSASVRTCVLLP